MSAVTVGDTHFKWVNQDHLSAVLDGIDYYQPKYVVQMGDLYDFYSFSKYAKTLNLITPKDELLQARDAAETFWKNVKEAAPKAKRIQLLGNHDDRIIKMVMSESPELEAVLEYLDFNKLWKFKGVQTQTSSRDEVIIEGLYRDRDVMFQHGHRAGLGAHARYNQMNTVVGHSHHGGVVYHRYKKETLWELNSGYIGDQSSLPFGYGAQRLSNSVPGYGLIDDDGPRFIPLN